MAYTLIIFILSLLWYLIPLPPDSLEPTPSGLFQNYGFEQNDSEKFALIVHLIQSGAYKVEEEDIFNHLNNEKKADTSRSFYKLFSSQDSFVIEQYDGRAGGVSDVARSVYSKNGELLLESWKGKIVNAGYFKNKQLRIDSVRVRPRRGVDSIIVSKITKFDSLGRPFEIDEFNMDPYKTYRNTEKTLYHYSLNGNHIEEMFYSRKFPVMPSRSKDQLTDSLAKEKYKLEYQAWDHELQFGKTEHELKKKVLTEIDSSSRIISTKTFNYHSGTFEENWFFDSIRYDKNWHQVEENKRKKYWDSEEAAELKITFLRNLSGLLLSKTTNENGKEIDREIWTYNKKGNCTSHRRGEHLEQWFYDSRGNLIEYDTGGIQKNKFKIYYK